MTQSKEVSTLSFQLPEFDAANRVFNAAELSADFDYKGDARTLHGKLTTPISISFEAAPVFRLGAFELFLTGSHPILSDELNANIKGNVHLDYAEQTAKVVFNAKIEDSHITGTVSLKDFDRPVFAVDISNNHLDLNRYLAGGWIRHLQDDATTFNTAGLKDVILQGSLRSGEINIDKLKVSKLAANLKIEKSNITLSPLSAHLYGGALTGNISVTANETPTVTIKQSLRGVQMGALLADTPNADRLAGEGTLDLDMSAQGGSIGALRKTMNGNVSFAIAQGMLAGINLRSALIDGKSDLGTKNAERSLPANFAEKTQFSELKASFNFKDGKVSASGFEMKSPFLRTAGGGEIDLDSGNLNYRLNATVSSAINRRTAGDL
ncbi:MAG: AsmA family protein, partial [Gallionella sp.]